MTGLTSLRTLLLAMNCFTSRAPCILPGPYLAGLTLLGLSDCFDEVSALQAQEQLCTFGNLYAGCWGYTLQAQPCWASATALMR